MQFTYEADKWTSIRQNYRLTICKSAWIWLINWVEIMASIDWLLIRVTCVEVWRIDGAAVASSIMCQLISRTADHQSQLTSSPSPAASPVTQASSVPPSHRLQSVQPQHIVLYIIIISYKVKKNQALVIGCVSEILFFGISSFLCVTVSVWRYNYKKILVSDSIRMLYICFSH